MHLAFALRFAGNCSRESGPIDNADAPASEINGVAAVAA